MEQELAKFINDLQLIYVPIDNLESLEKIYNLYINHKLFDAKSAIEFLYLGLYYEIEKDYDQSKKYYLMAIDKGDCGAMYNLGVYYETIEKDYDQAKKYYLMAIDNGDSNAMNNLGLYYETIEKDYDQAKKYYLMAIDNGNDTAMNNLAEYYETIEDYDQMKKYYLMAIDNGNSKAMARLVYYYKTNNMVLDKIELLTNYSHLSKRDKIMKSITACWNSGLTNNNQNKFVNILSEFEFDDNDFSMLPISLSLFIKSIRNQFDIMKLHFDYTLEGKGYLEARADFIERLG